MMPRPLRRREGVARLPRPRRRRGRWPRQPQLTARDLEILRWVCRHGVVTPEQVAQRFFWRDEKGKAGEWAAYRRLAALRELGLMLGNKPFADRPMALRVTREGARLADVGLRPAPLVLSELEHTIALVWLTEDLLAEHPDAELLTERELRAQRYRDQREGISHTGGRTPDAILKLPARSGAARTIAIELDLTRKDRRALERIVRGYDRERVDAVWWYVRQPRVERVREVVRALRAGDRIEVREWRG